MLFIALKVRVACNRNCHDQFKHILNGIVLPYNCLASGPPPYNNPNCLLVGPCIAVSDLPLPKLLQGIHDWAVERRFLAIINFKGSLDICLGLLKTTISRTKADHVTSHHTIHLRSHFIKGAIALTIWMCREISNLSHVSLLECHQNLFYLSLSLPLCRCVNSGT